VTAAALGKCPAPAGRAQYAPRMRHAVPAGFSWGAIVLLAAGCGRTTVEIIGALPDGSAPAVCPATLAERLSVAQIPVGNDVNIAWQKMGYDHFPVDERVALAVQPDGQAQIAWTESSPAAATSTSAYGPLGVHVTPLDANLARRADDVFMPTGLEVSGLVAHDDGFALLTRDTNTGVAINGDDSNTIGFLLRYQNGGERWKQELTGSNSEDAAETHTVYSPFLEGQLLWSDSAYGAYFVVKGGAGDSNQGYWWDLLVFRDSFGRPAPIPLAHGCANNGGIRLIPDANKANLVPGTYPSQPAMTAACVQQSRQTVKLTGLEADRLISDQEVNFPGYAGARFGSLLKVADGYLVYWLSLGATNQQTGHDIRMARLDRSFNVVSGPTWVTQTPGREEWNLHVVPYGPDHFLMIYLELTITSSAFDHYAMYLGNLVGTHLVLLDAGGTPISDELVQGAPITANDEPVLLGSDVAWPFVNPAPDFTHTVDGTNGPGQTNLHVARVRYCQ
jgi:hypothetical protein